MARFSERAVNLAKAHIQHFQPSDFYQKQLEFDALFAHWEEVKAYLLEHAIKNFAVSTPRLDYCPKPRGGYRAIHQLDPLDSLIYTAFAFELGNTIEQQRMPESEGIACSYRVKINSNGNLFRQGNGYRNFLRQSVRLAKENNFVLMTDIKDFYNQINLDCLQSALVNCDAVLSEELADFLLKLQYKNKKGIPVGPSPSIILAEIFMNEVDKFLHGKGYDFARYVDDFRIFSNSETELKEIISELAAYLAKNYQLRISNDKTHLIPSHLFLKALLENPLAQETSAIYHLLATSAVSGSLGVPSMIYGSGVSLAENVDKNIFKNEQLFYEFVEQLTKHKFLNIGLSRYILQHSKKIKTYILADKIFAKFDFFAPVMRDVIIYLDSITDAAFTERYKKQVIHVINHSRSLKNPFVKSWFDNYLIHHSGFANTPEIKAYLQSASIRDQALLAVKNHASSWTRKHKADLHQQNLNDKRAIIYSANTLPEGEKNAWLKTLGGHHTDFVTDILVKWVRAH